MKSIMPLVAVAMTLALSTLPFAAAAGTRDEVSIVTTVDRPSGPGAPVRQTATVTDTGEFPLLGLRIHLDLAPGCHSFVSVLAPAAAVTVTCDGTAGDTDSVLTATVSGHDLLHRPVTATATTILRLPHPALRLDVTATPTLAVPGQSVRYALSVTNAGDVPLAGLAVTATGTSGCDRTVPGILAVGASASIGCTTAAGQRDWSTTFHLSGHDTFDEPVSAVATVDIAVVVPSLTMALSGPAGPTPAGHDAVITVLLTDTSTVALSDLRVTGSPVACDRHLPSLAGGATSRYTCSIVVDARTIVALAVTAVPAVGGIPVPGVAAVTEHSTLVLRQAAPPAPPKPKPAPTEPAAKVTPPPVTPAVALPAPKTPRAPVIVARSVPSTSARVAVPARPPRPPVIGGATGPLANPGRTAAVIAVLAALVMTVSVGALAAATRPGK